MLNDLLKRNTRWSEKRAAEDPEFFVRLAMAQAPEVFWIGCSDSRVSADAIAGVAPGEVFVHRNVANVIHPSDMNLLSALEYAVEVLKVRQVVLCGHYGCGGVQAADEGLVEGLNGHWLAPIRSLAKAHRKELEHALDDKERRSRLAELNVIEGVGRLAQTPIVQRAWARQEDLRIHGLIYGLEDGRLRDLKCTLTCPPSAP